MVSNSVDSTRPATLREVLAWGHAIVMWPQGRLAHGRVDGAVPPAHPARLRLHPDHFLECLTSDVLIQSRAWYVAQSQEKLKQMQEAVLKSSKAANGKGKPQCLGVLGMPSLSCRIVLGRA